MKPASVLIIGSGPIVIGQAAEFDYAGTQACKAMREEGVRSILVNSNPATIMTDLDVADRVYIEPLTVPVLERIIARERPEGLLPTLGGQTGLNLAVDLANAGVLEKYGVRLLGTPLETIRRAEDRELFRDMLASLGEPVLESEICHTLAECEEAAHQIGLPVVIRPAYTLGGTGGGMAFTWEQLRAVAISGLAASPITQVLVEKNLLGWKEVEYEVMRDGAGNCITICNMENLDPMGVHTGDSIVVAPSQTLSDKDYQMLRSASLRIITELGIEGGCNVQFALAPRKDVRDWKGDLDEPLPYHVIEVNPRVSRSSALASKATGYPIARVAAKIACGKTLGQIPNAVTQRTTAAFEPALDYCVVKIPRWPFDKFHLGDRSLGTQMKATGEVMAIERTFEAALNKAVRSLEVGGRSLLWERREWRTATELPLHASDERLWALVAALRRGQDAMELSRITGVDPWFLDRLGTIVAMEKRLLNESLHPELLHAAKRLGFSDEMVAQVADRLPEQIRSLRHEWNIRPVYKMVDTCAAEFDAATPYFYSTYESENEATAVDGAGAVVIGSGPIRIGQGIEFDYASVHAAWALQRAGLRSIMANSNPETVSTDFDTSDRLYFEPLDEEAMRDIIENEQGNEAEPPASIVQFGGQTAINLAEPLRRSSLPIIGSSAEAIDTAEDRRLFERFLQELGIPQPPGAAVTSLEEGMKTAQNIGYPVLVRPSYVLGGRAMEIVQNASEMVGFLAQAAEAAQGKPILIDKFLEGSEVEVDAICDGETVLIPGIMEHIERAGVHSGDSMAVYPPVHLDAEEKETIRDYTERIVLGMGAIGLTNIQYVVLPRLPGEGPAIYVLEVNPRASRTVPFLSKVTGVPMVQLAVNAMLGRKLRDQGYPGGLWPERGLVAIKAPVFSMSKLVGVDTHLGPEMKSTGEVMGIDRTLSGALAKALLASDLALKPRAAVLLSISDRTKASALPLIHKLAGAGYTLYATEGTSKMIEALGIPVTPVTKILSGGHPNVVDVVMDGTVQCVINTTEGRFTGSLRDGFHIRRAAAERRIPCFTSLDTAAAAIEALGNASEYEIATLAEYVAG
ncbi:MAG: carbamoyl-phosphate synthase large subunit [Chloroflexi bacterium CFX7]|nr:carbamoyl-phosphate synthase large subunit [Chloroflexi bacterium CFX7]MCK6564514.1 carbamoyl-phosphate synthase large subunit [Dehalococcoidia bacterium]RIL01780.1 MAG: carbamoyl phosphate synthase large subunit [bacterium]